MAIRNKKAVTTNGNGAAKLPTPPGKAPFRNMMWIPSGTFTMGSDKFYPEEGPLHQVSVTGFWMDKYTVTNKQFRRFVEETGYVTVAERLPDPADYPGAQPELLVPGSAVFRKPKQRVDLRDWQQWWEYVAEASWRHPEGAGSSLKGRANHPVVHVAYEDAETYCSWAGKELPTEGQWEFAARGGLEKQTYTWGNEFAPKGTMMANTWQGEFPWQNLELDGYERTAPVGTFQSNGYGLYDMAGNVWEWTNDWYQSSHPEDPDKPCCIPINPRGANQEDSLNPNMPHIKFPRKVLKGGSFLCAPNYCLRYRPAARHPETVDTSTCHIGFRCIVNVTT